MLLHMKGLGIAGAPTSPLPLISTTVHCSAALLSLALNKNQIKQLQLNTREPCGHSQGAVARPLPPVTLQLLKV